MRVNTDLFSLSAEVQAEINERHEYEQELSRRHCSYVHFIAESINQPDSYRSIDDPEYREPTPSEIREVFEHLAHVHSKGIVTKMLGIKGKSNPMRTINRWIDGESSIPYPAWRLLLILDGRVVQTNRLPTEIGEKPWKKYYKKV
ncbi:MULTISPECIES: hypothetical protein [unclassified Photobacterium]|uniref:hypothetical protein n=1 Tax=unclassified Photobacterium TaxID=2628852 RepID=UPI000D17C289|nr:MULTISPECIES: hypothetical protein [unclassified Photobacterium]PSV33674.1 hypothetical protein C9J38_19960 [Photobacterium sp. GB-210]PSV42037.1 hypothetical protein C9J46_15685 [Photobacterium sp. GB-36]